MSTISVEEQVVVAGRPDTEQQTEPSWWWAVAGVAGTLLVWWLLTEVVFAGRALVQDFSPVATVTGIRELAGIPLLDDASASMFRLVSGLAIAAVVGVTLGVGIGTSAKLRSLTQPTVGFLRMISPLSWAPVAVIAFGIGDPPVIALVAVTATWPVLLATVDGLANVNDGHRKIARALGATSFEEFRYVTIPSVIPYLLSGLRLAIGIGWVVLVPAEMLGVTSGLGYAVLNAKDQLAYHHVTALILVIGVIGVALDTVARWLVRTNGA